MKTILCAFFLFFTLLSCQEETTNKNSNEASKADIENMLDAWHAAAANADFDAYFSLMATDAVYIGTDATENWNLEEFKKFAKPYFEKGKAWAFTSLDRHIYFSENGKIAWFDELLKTQMGLCRGSGVLAQENGSWKITHYVLSMTVPNDRMEKVSRTKQDFDDSYIQKLISTKK